MRVGVGVRFEFEFEFEFEFGVGVRSWCSITGEIISLRVCVRIRIVRISIRC